MLVGHGNSLRALIKIIEKISDQDISKVNIPTGLPLYYEVDELMNIIDKKYLGD